MSRKIPRSFLLRNFRSGSQSIFGIAEALPDSERLKWRAIEEYFRRIFGGLRNPDSINVRHALMLMYVRWWSSD